MFRRELLGAVLPFPDAPGVPYHDHWTALVALATGRIAYVDRPLLDYVQHPGAVLGHEAIEARPRISRGQRLRRLGRDPSAARERWREAYEDEWCRIVALARALEERCEPDPADRRALDLVLAGDRSPRTWAWLAVRPLRAIAGRNETRGFEHRLLRGLAVASLREPPGNPPLAALDQTHDDQLVIAHDGSNPTFSRTTGSRRKRSRMRSRPSAPARAGRSRH